MGETQGRVVGLLKRLLFRERAKHPRLQPLWSRLHTLSLFGMNYGGGALVETTGEQWVFANVVAPACRKSDGPVIFDVGANVGDYTLLADRYAPDASIYAFEPSAPVYEQLRRNVNGNCVAHVETFNIGLSDTDGTSDLYLYEVEGQEVSLISSIDRRLPTQTARVEVCATERVKVQTLDRFCEEHGVSRIDFLKLDVEGHEMAVLRGARRMLSEGAISMIQFEFGAAAIYSRTFFYDFWSLLSGAFDIFRIIPKGITPIAYYGEHREIFLVANYLAVRRADAR